MISKKILKILLYISTRAVLYKFKPKVINITGSVGKTSTKEFTAELLASKFKILKTKYTQNTEFSVPTNILQIPLCGNIRTLLAKTPQILKLIFIQKTYPEILVLETAVCLPCKRGRIRYLARLTRPSIGILTKIAPSHMELFGTIENVVKEKQGLVEELPSSGFAILNYDDPHIRQMKNHTAAHILFYGLDRRADVWAENIKISLENGLTFTLHCQNISYPIKIPKITNKFHIYPILAAISTGLVCGMNLPEIVKKIRSFKTIKGRGNVISGIKNTLIINDCFNSNPASCIASLENFKEIAGARRKIVVLGDMLEQGDNTEKSHRQIGIKAKDTADFLICVGKNSKFIAQEAQNQGLPKEKISWHKNSEKATKFIAKISKPQDAILIKGSHGMRLEKIIENLKAND